MWDFATGKEINTLLDSKFIAIAPTNQTFLTKTNIQVQDSFYNHDVLKLWSLSTGTEIRTLKDEYNSYNLEIEGRNSVAISSDGKTLVNGDSDDIYIQNLATGKIIRTLKQEGYVGKFLFSLTPDGQTLISNDGQAIIKFWNLAGGNVTRIMPISTNEDEEISYGTISDIAVNWSKQILVAASDKNIIDVWNLATGKRIARLQDHSNEFNSSRINSSVVISSDGQTIVSTDNNTIKVWRISN